MDVFHFAEFVKLKYICHIIETYSGFQWVIVLSSEKADSIIIHLLEIMVIVEIPVISEVSKRIMGPNNYSTWVTIMPLTNISVSLRYHHPQITGSNFGDNAHIPKKWREWNLVSWWVVDACHRLLIVTGMAREEIM